ncbi:MAG: hypothetical protein HC904_09695 [Blastochloris sp.]|nr:hypothetical protein [Blastochloris sp.]
MSFTEWYYLFYLALTALLFWQLKGQARIWLIWIASYIFYGAWDLRFLSLIMATTVIDYFGALALSGQRRPLAQVATFAFLPPVWYALTQLGLNSSLPPLTHLIPTFGLTLTYLLFYTLLWKLPAQRRRQAFLLLSIFSSLSLLGFFKYCNFFLDSLLHFLNFLGFNAMPHPLHPSARGHLLLHLPIHRLHRGCLSRKNRRLPLLPPLRQFRFLFPQLVAGPIERSHDLMPQLQQPRPFHHKLLHRAALLLLIGYFKKFSWGTIAPSSPTTPSTNPKAPPPPGSCSACWPSLFKFMVISPATPTSPAVPPSSSVWS